MKTFLSTLFLLSTLTAFSQVQIINSIPKDGVVLNKGWKFHAGDNNEWAKTDFDDSKWQTIDPTVDVSEIPQIRQQPIGWLRIKFYVDSSLLNKPLAYHIFQSIASQVYINGKLSDSFGVVSADKNKIKEWRPSNDPEGIVFTQQEQTIAVKFSLKQSFELIHPVADYNGLIFRISNVKDAARISELNHQFPFESAMFAAFFGVISLLNFVLYITRQFKKEYLYFTIACLSATASSVVALFVDLAGISMLVINYAQAIAGPLLFVEHLYIYLAIHKFSHAKKSFIFWFIVVLTPIYIIIEILLGFNFFAGYMITVFIIGGESTRLSINVYRKGNKNALILIAGFFFYWITFCLLIAFILTSGVDIKNNFNLTDFFWIVASISVPLSIIIYFAVDFASTSKELAKKLTEVEQLSTEKQQILLSQNETLELQVTQRTFQLNQSLQELKSTQAQLIQSEKMASLGELTAGIAHEIQNPLNFVNNFSEVSNELLDDMNEELVKGDIEEVKNISNDIKQNLQKINHHGKRADAIVKGMLQHSRQTKGIKELIDINKLCEEFLRLSYHGLRAKDKNFNTNFKTDFDENISQINVVSQDMGRVLLNLFNNAFYAVNEKIKTADSSYKPLVSVRTKKINDKIEIIVEDNGSGISKAIIDKIFQPFFTTKPTGSGTGLGLSLSYDIITKEHGGTIKAESKEGEGSTFIICLPTEN